MLGRLRALRRGRARGWSEERARGYVGPPEYFDLITAMSFGLLTSLGLREHHRLLDIGCGSLRIGRLLVPYLGRGNYVGIEPNRRALDSGVRLNLGESTVELKQPRLIASGDPEAVPGAPPFDFAFAQSIFSHTGPDLLSGWLAGVSPRLSEAGVLVASYVPGADSAPEGWEPTYVTYSERWLGELAAEAGLELTPIDWRHPGGQRWALFSKPGFEVDWIEASPLSWNSYVQHEFGSDPVRARRPIRPADRDGGPR